jgi:hypothetical protein
MNMNNRQAQLPATRAIFSETVVSASLAYTPPPKKKLSGGCFLRLTLRRLCGMLREMENNMAGATVLNRVIENDSVVSGLSLPGNWRGAMVELRIISPSKSTSPLRPARTSYGILKAGKKGIHNNYSDEQLLEIIQDTRKTHQENI